MQSSCTRQLCQDPTELPCTRIGNAYNSDTYFSPNLVAHGSLGSTPSIQPHTPTTNAPTPNAYTFRGAPLSTSKSGTTSQLATPDSLNTPVAHSSLGSTPSIPQPHTYNELAQVKVGVHPVPRQAHSVTPSRLGAAQSCPVGEHPATKHKQVPKCPQPSLSMTLPQSSWPQVKVGVHLSPSKP
jgi:hypothetical protein